MVTGVGSVHHTQCWSVHLDCARAEVIRLQNVNATVREELATTRRQLLNESAALEAANQHRARLADQLDEARRINETYSTALEKP